MFFIEAVSKKRQPLAISVRSNLVEMLFKYGFFCIKYAKKSFISILAHLIYDYRVRKLFYF